MQRADDRDHETPPDDESGGGLRYQQARRSHGEAATDDSVATAGTRSGLARDVADADQQQRADDHGGPDPDDESWLQDQGYPKLGKGVQSRLNQVEHGPYAGGSQQGDEQPVEARETAP